MHPRLPPWTARLRPWVAPIAFVGGVVFDALTLRRVDDLRSNIRLTLLLLVAGLLLTLERRAWHGRWVPQLAARHPTLLRAGLQFCFGGLLSAYLIFYSHSASVGPSLLFCALLAVLMLANELWYARLRPDGPQVALWYFLALSYLLFAVPTWTGILDDRARLAASVGALALATALVGAMHLGPIVDPSPPSGPDPLGFLRSLARHQAGWLGMLAGLIALVQLGAVPPVPLALSEAGVFHTLRATADGYEVTYDAPPWWVFWREDDRVFQLHPGDTVVCFTAVFAPTGADLALTDVWERRGADGGWLEADRIPWQMHGGRDGGWRAWTQKRNVSPGEWRVRVVGEQGWELGQVSFTVVDATGTAPRRLTRRL